MEAIVPLSTKDVPLFSFEDPKAVFDQAVHDLTDDWFNGIITMEQYRIAYSILLNDYIAAVKDYTP